MENEKCKHSGNFMVSMTTQNKLPVLKGVLLKALNVRAGSMLYYLSQFLHVSTWLQEVRFLTNNKSNQHHYQTYWGSVREDPIVQLQISILRKKGNLTKGWNKLSYWEGFVSPCCKYIEIRNQSKIERKAFQISAEEVNKSHTHCHHDFLILFQTSGPDTPNPHDSQQRLTKEHKCCVTSTACPYWGG